MARNRSILNRKRRNKKEPFDIDITSLLDILVILLVFLLRSYNSNGIQMNIPKGIEIPKSSSSRYNTPGVMIQVAKDAIYVDNKTIVTAKDNPSKVTDHAGKRIIPLYNELIKKKEEIKKISLVSKNANKFSGVANLIVDKSIKYSYLKKLMYTCADAGFKQYKFVVLGEEL